jgi:hypothetical protein
MHDVGGATNWSLLDDEGKSYLRTSKYALRQIWFRQGEENTRRFDKI